MRRGWKILIGVVVALAILLTLNTVAIDNQTKGAEVTVSGGKILKLAGGDIQVKEVGPTAPSVPRPGATGSSGSSGQRAASPPIVLIHCYTCAIDWWDGMIPLLSRTHRVVAIDLLGHGGSEKPSSGYGIEQQASLVAQALNKLGVEGAVVVGHSLGAAVATELAAQSRQLVDRLVVIDEAPDSSFGDLGTMAKLSYQPVLGQAMWRVLPDGAIKDGLGEAFAPGYDVPDAFVDDLKRMTYTSYKASYDDEKDYTDERPLDERIRAALVPALVIFGSEDQIYDARKAIAAYAGIPGARTAIVQGAGHSPNVEKPAQTAKLVLGFARPTALPTLPPEKPPLGKHPPRRAGGGGDGRTARQVVATCDDAIIGSGQPDYRKRSTTAGTFSLFGGGRDFSNASRQGNVFVAKMPAIVAGHAAVTVTVSPKDQSRARLVYGSLHSPRSLADGATSVVFKPCGDKPRTVYPGGMVLADRRPVKLQVKRGGRTGSLTVG
jgi:pimeloyl-ACP methyl ester carboxylesterase